MENENNGKNIAAIRMVTRLVFIWFMKQKELVPGYLFTEKDVKEILLDLSPDGDSYYKAILQNLFFATLNTPTAQRKFRAQIESQNKNKDFMEHSYYRYERYFKDPRRILSLFKDIPFLNGGLFDCLDEWLDEAGENRYIRIDGFSDRADNPLHVPNCLFFSPEQSVDLNKEYGTKNVKYTVRGLINILESYNFTIDENTPVDEEIALDPELLGRVFENLLASYNPETATTARKATGSYYTPREIVSYMVEESLKQFLKTALGPAQDLDEKLNSLLSYNTDINPFNDHDSSKLINAINSLKIIDPAVGSGAFPMGILQRLVLVLSKLDPHNEKWERQQIDAVEKNVSDIAMKRILIAEIERNFRKNELDYGRKLYLIQNCIYGVDIQPIAIQIAKLRFFISLLVDEKLDAEEKDKGIKPLPNLDFKLVCANSLIGLPEMHKPSSDNYALAALESEKQELGKEYVRKLNSGKLDIFEKKQIGDRLKSIDKKIAATRQTGCDESDVHSLFSSSDTITGLQDVRAKYFAATSKAEKNKLKDKFFKIQEQIRAEVGWSVQDAAQTKLFGYEGVKLKTKTKGTEKAAKLGAWDPFSNKPCEWFDPEWMFGADNGFDIVIANPPYVRQEDIKEFKPAFKEQYECFTGTADLYVYFYERSFKLLKDNGILTFISSNKYFRAGYGEKLRGFLATNSTIHQLIDFGDAPVFTAIAYPSIIVLSKSKALNGNKSRVFSWDPAAATDEFVSYFNSGSFLMPQAELKPDGWRLESQKVLNLLAKLRKAGKPLGEYVNGRFYRGILTGLNEAFVVDRVTRDRLIAEHKSSADVLKPFLRGRDVKRWQARPQDLWLMFIPWHFPLHQDNAITGASKKAETEFKRLYPAIYRHLFGFKEALSARNAVETGIRYEWYALQRWGAEYWREFEQSKIIIPAITDAVNYASDTEGYFSNDKTSLCITDKPNFL
ncbi:MAG: Eco57I restriction-modification methylase domain-containing protein, partial [Elusimicrobiota bacterium]|nr:Eco57I restriction-modification methylase domain-containing protein [Elusimicrobiota bacterium]